MPIMRNIIAIDRDKCNGCGECLIDCAEGALAIVNGKATVVAESLCDGLGACLSGCPQEALHIIRRSCDPFDQQAVETMRAEQAVTASADAAAPAPGEKPTASPAPTPALADAGGTVLQSATMPLPPIADKCPGAAVRQFASKSASASAPATACSSSCECAPTATSPPCTHWPIKLRLIPASAPFVRGAHVVLLADCASAASPDVHRILAARTPSARLIACPKFEDAAELQERLTTLLAQARPASLEVIRMEVPCCRSLASLCHASAKAAQLDLTVTERVLGCDGLWRENV